MSTITQMTTVPADLSGAQALPPPPAPANSAAAAKPARTTTKPAAEDGPRLVIREGAEAGLFVYTIIDRASGLVMAQIPREEVVKLSASPNYQAGQILDTTA